VVKREKEDKHRDYVARGRITRERGMDTARIFNIHLRKEKKGGVMIEK